MTTIIATTEAGTKLFAAIDPKSPVGRHGVVAHSAEAAALAPFTSLGAAFAALQKHGGKIDPPWRKG